MLKKILIFSYLSFTLLHAGSFEFTSIKRDSSGAINDSGLKIANEKEIIATGYGTTQQQALDNAFKTAIEQYVGVVVDSETMMKNGKLIKDNILTASNGFIKSYKELSVENSDGLIEVKINALVKSQKVLNKIKSLNITTISIDNSKDTYARVVTKIKARKDAEKILKKVVDDFFSNQSLQDMLNITIKDVKIDEGEAKNNKVPINISYTLELDYKIYLQKVKQLEQVFENLGAKLRKRVDLLNVSPNGLSSKNKKKIAKLTNTDFGIIKRYGKGYKLDIWEFPKDWKNMYILNYKTDIRWKSIFQVILELQDRNDEVLYAENITPYRTLRNNRLLLTTINPGWRSDTYSFSMKEKKSPIALMPTFENIDNELDFSVQQMINVSDIGKIKNITIELEVK